MRTLLIAGILGAGIFLSGCVPFFVERRHDHEKRDNDRQGQRDDHYRDNNNDRRDRTDH